MQHHQHILRNKPFRLCLTALLLVAGCETVKDAEGPTGGDAIPESVTAYNELLQPFMNQYCYSCHNVDDMKGGVDLESFETPEIALGDTALWERVEEMLRTGQMPPERRPQPSAEELEKVLAFIASHQEATRKAIKSEPGQITMRRLNRAEYNNTVRDLLGVAFTPADDFPPDDSGYGFDTIGSVLTLSPMLMEKYLTAAERIAHDVYTRETGTESKEVSRRYVFTCEHEGKAHMASCAQRVLAPVVRRAYRRTPTREEMNALLHFVQLARDNEDTFEQGIEVALQAMLVSPQFLYRVEENPKLRFGNPDRRVNDFELASRISYFLWSSMPDDALLRAAEQGQLQNPRTLRLQIARMLRDEKSIAMAEHFAGQWLEFRNMAVADPDPKLFPTFDKPLREAMEKETILFYESIVREDRSVLDFIDADYTYLNASLANHYGIDGVTGENFQRVTVDRAQRGGVLTQASILTVTSYPTRTSPVLRGVWILHNILAAPPPPPPPDVPALESAKVDQSAPMRARLEEHRSNESCASCHARIDPLGFGLENFDAVGAWRTTDGDHPIDNSGTLPDGRSFTGVAELKSTLLERKDEFVRCLAEKMLVYGLGRGLEPFDEPVLDEIVAQVARNDYRYSALVYEIVRSLPFQKRRGEPEKS